MEKSGRGKEIDAELISIHSIDVTETIILTGGLKARSCDDECVQIYPFWRDGEPIWGEHIPCDNFLKFLKERSVDIIGIKQDTRAGDGNHWRWAPAKACHNPPHNNPSYRWRFLSSGICRSVNSGETLSVIGAKSNETISEVDAKKLSDLARHIAIDLHHLNHAIAMMAEYLHIELVSQGPRSRRYSHIRSLDLSAYVHGFFQVFSAARDHYAQFLAIQIGQKKVEGEKIDSMFNLLNASEPSQLRQLKIIKLLEQKNLLEVGKGKRRHTGRSRLVYKSDTWLKYSNDLRNRFTHGSPYGTMEGEDMTEILQPDGDRAMFLAKTFLDKGEGEFTPDLLRTINNLYQGVCALFLIASEVTGYKYDPLSVNLKS
ncbi:hypothetical protein [Ponticoccus sp. (in: a-proteobacteria)]|uniref:hypothetical protein n=1 Tax=Ponticoccus sp. (in: a-proteobacteria) TaxID=1925025 RepID=UPI003AB3E354